MRMFYNGTLHIQFRIGLTNYVLHVNKLTVFNIYYIYYNFLHIGLYITIYYVFYICEWACCLFCTGVDKLAVMVINDGATH